MGIEDIPKVVKAAKAAKATTRLVRVEGVVYRVPGHLDDVEAARYVWNNVLKPKSQGGEKAIELPSELPKERQEVLEAEANPPKADVLPFKKDAGLRPDIWDAENGIGAIPNTMPENQSYYNVITRWMTPKKFLSHAYHEPNLLADPSHLFLKEKLREGNKLAPPFLDVYWDEVHKNWIVRGHEGRHRSALIQQQYGASVEMPVLLRPHTKDGYPIKGEGALTEEQKRAPIVGVGAAAGGVVVEGNIELDKRPVVKNADGSISTVRSMSFEEDGVEVLIPTVSDDGKILSDEEAIALYRETGKHLGKFSSPEAATEYAQKLHEEQDKMYSKQPKKLEPGIYVDEDSGKYFKIDKNGDMQELTDETP